MNLSDIITLAKQGYKPGDIKELIELSKTVPEQPEPDLAKNEKQDIVPPEEQKDPEPDYKTELEKLMKETEQLKADLKAAQEHNRNQANPEQPKPSREESLKDIAMAFLR